MEVSHETKQSKPDREKLTVRLGLRNVPRRIPKFFERIRSSQIKLALWHYCGDPRIEKAFSHLFYSRVFDDALNASKTVTFDISVGISTRAMLKEASAYGSMFKEHYSDKAMLRRWEQTWNFANLEDIHCIQLFCYVFTCWMQVYGPIFVLSVSWNLDVVESDQGYVFSDANWVDTVYFLILYDHLVHDRKERVELHFEWSRFLSSRSLPAPYVPDYLVDDD